MAPHLVKWHEEFSPRGLVVIEIDNGAIDPLQAVQAWAAAERVPYPVLHDAGGAMCERFGVSMYPSKYLIDRSGKVVWEGHGWSQKDPADIERAIRKALGSG